MRNLPLSQTLGKESKRSMGTSNGDTAPAYTAGLAHLGRAEVFQTSGEGIMAPAPLEL